MAATEQRFAAQHRYFAQQYGPTTACPAPPVAAALMASALPRIVDSLQAWLQARTKGRRSLVVDNSLVDAVVRWANDGPQENVPCGSARDLCILADRFVADMREHFETSMNEETYRRKFIAGASALRGAFIPPQMSRLEARDDDVQGRYFERSARERALRDDYLRRITTGEP
jgi:hypothetical protein